MSLPSKMLVLSTDGRIAEMFINCGWHDTPQDIIRAMRRDYVEWLKLAIKKDPEISTFYPALFSAYGKSISMEELLLSDTEACAKLKKTTDEDIKSFGIVVTADGIVMPPKDVIRIKLIG